MRKGSLGRLLFVCALGLAGAAAAAEPAAPAPVAASTGTAQEEVPQAAFELSRSSFLAQVRASYLDRSGRTPLPSLEPMETSTATVDQELRSLAAQAAYVQLGRGPEDLPAYADMIVLVAMRLGIDPPELALPIYRDRARAKDQALTPQQGQGFAELTDALRNPTFHRRYLFVADLYGKKTSPPPASAPPAAGRKRRKGRVPVPPPPGPSGPPHSVLETVDWKRADELADAAAEGADGWNRKTKRRRRGRCYEWVRMALQKTGLWTDAYRTEVTSRGDWRRPRRAYSFAWAMNIMESRREKDPFAGRRAPLRQLDLRVDPLVKGSIVVFDRNICGHNNRSGHIEVISSVDPLLASSYKFHEVKLDCLIKAADEGKVHIYVPQRLDPYPPAASAPAASLHDAPASPDAAPAQAIVSQSSTAASVELQDAPASPSAGPGARSPGQASP